MSLASPRPETAGQLVYCQDGEANESALDSETSRELLIQDSDAGGFKGESMYVTLFEEMVKVVLEAEEYLFDASEVACFERYKKLSYRARYLFIRLCLRKNDRWIRLGDLKYQRELGDNILAAMHELCSTSSDQPPVPSASTPSTSTQPSGKVKTEERDDIIDLTLDEDEDEEDVKPDISKLTKIEENADALPFGTQQEHEPDYSVLADDESRASVRDLLECLRVDELREIVKEMKVPKTENKRDALINALLHITSGQSTLSFPVVSTTSSAKGTGNEKRPKKKFVQASLTAYMPGRKTQTQKDRLRAVVTQRIGACIKLNPDVVRLFRRVNVVYFRSTIYTPTLLTNAILARCKKRTFEPVPYTRSTRIWPSREALLQYEEALEWEAQVDEILGTSPSSSNSSSSRSRSVASKTPAPGGRLRSAGSKSPSKRGGGEEGEEEGAEDTPRMRDAREVKAIFERVYPLWKEVVAVKGEEEGRGQGLERFHHGHVLTRIICKGASALGTLHEHTREYTLLGELLAQRRWRRGRRGRWYERRALILMTHCEKGEENWREAWRVVVGALEDEDTHIVYRPKLLRRLKTLEKRLGVPEEERVQVLGGLNQAEQEVIQGVRVYPAVDASGRLGVAEIKSGSNDGTSFVIDVDSKAKVKQSKLPFTQTAAGDNEGVKVQLPWTGKSVWRGRDGEEVNVETFALQHYETLGYKGFHSEGRIVTTIFGLLFWDLIFAPIPGAFETAYQLAPLDITEETFYTARQDLMQARLDTIRGGRAAEILAATYDQYSAEKRGCVGVRWDLFGREDLVEIVECLDPAGLAAICQTVAEDYGNRTAGVPDLIIWNREMKTCKFVEVKGPGDNLQENQKVWIDVLLQAGIPVEVCRVAEEGEDGSPKMSKAKAKSRVKKEKEATQVSTMKKRKRKVEEEGENTPESEDEVDYSLLDPSQDVDADMLPTPIVKPEFPGVERMSQKVEVLITTPSPRKKRRPNAD